MRTLILILLTFILASCSQADAGIVSPEQTGTGQTPSPVPVPTPVPVPVTPVLTVTVSQVIAGNPAFQGPQDAWHVVLKYDYTPDPLYPCVWVETYYQWGSTFRRNIKIWDCIAKPGPILDDFYDYAWAEPVIVYSVKIFTCSVNSGDWFDGFCMGDPSDYWGTVSPNWLYCPIDGVHPNGLRIASGLVVAKSSLPQVNRKITITGFGLPLIQ